MTASDIDTSVPLHPDFARRLKVAGVGQDATYYATRWAAVTAYADDVDVPRALDLVRLTAGEALAGDRPAGFRDALRLADPGFAEGDNAFEMTILAGFVLVHLWGVSDAKASPVADVAALALSTWDFGGRAAGTPSAVFVSEARAYRSRRAAAVAAAPLSITAALKSPISSKQIIDQATAAIANNQLPQIADLLGQVSSAVETLHKHQRTLASTAETALQALREEADVAWWVLSEYSNDFDMHVSALPPTAAALILGKELGDLAGALPGTPASTAVLDRLLRAHFSGQHTSADAARASGQSARRRKSDGTPASRPRADGDVSLHTAIVAAPPEWRRGWSVTLSASIRGSLTPVLTAVDFSLSTDADDEWVPAFRKAAGFDPKDAGYARSALILAQQAYDECVLARAVAAQR